MRADSFISKVFLPWEVALSTGYSGDPEEDQPITPLAWVGARVVLAALSAGAAFGVGALLLRRRR